MKNIFTMLITKRVLLLGLFCMVPATFAYAEDQRPQYERREATAQVSADVYEEMIKAQEAQEEGDIEKALEVLDGLKARTGRRALKPYELAQMWNFYAHAYLARDDYANAIGAFENLLKQDDVPQAMANNTRYTLAQLHFAQDNVEKSIELLEYWFTQAENPGPDAYILLTQAYLQNEQLDKALEQLQGAFAAARRQNREERENWYALLQYIFSEKEQYRKQIEALEVLVTRWPKQSYWLALIGAYAEQEQEDKQLAAMESAYVQGMLNQESYLVSYAQMLNASGVPYKAAKVMEKALENEQIEQNATNLERTGEYFRRAKEIEKAVPYLQQASEAADDGETAVRLAHVYINRHYYKEAVESIRLGLEKGGLDRPLEAQLLLAQALYHAGELEQAKNNLERFVQETRRREAERMHEQARRWLNFVKSEIERQEAIARYLNGDGA